MPTNSFEAYYRVRPVSAQVLQNGVAVYVRHHGDPWQLLKRLGLVRGVQKVKPLQMQRPRIMTMGQKETAERLRHGDEEGAKSPRKREEEQGCDSSFNEPARCKFQGRRCGMSTRFQARRVLA